MLTYPAIQILILAAGAASRFGAAKQLLPVDGVPMVRKVTLTALECGAGVIVVIGAFRALVEAQLQDLAVATAFNLALSLGGQGRREFGPADAGERLGDVRAASLSEPAPSAVVVVLGDQPLLASGDLRAMLARHAQSPDLIIAAVDSGVRGPPCLFPRLYFDELLALHGDNGARALLERHAAHVEAMRMTGPRLDVDTPDDYAALSHRQSE